MTAPTFPGDAPATPEVGPENTAVYLDQLAEDAAKAALPVDEDYEAQARDEKGRFTKVEDVAKAETGEGDSEATAEEVTAEATEGEATAEASDSPIPLADVAVSGLCLLS